MIQWNIINQILKIIITTVVVICITCYPYLNAQNISSFIETHSTTAPIIFIMICATRPVLFFMPSLGLTIVAGLLFGTVKGTLYVGVGGALSTITGFYFARWLGRNALEKLLKSHDSLKLIEKWSDHLGKNNILLMRLFNLPWDMVSYWAGLSQIRFKDFYIASIIPLIPISFLYTYLGSNIFNPLSVEFIIPLAIMFVMGSLPYITKLHLKMEDE